MSTQNLSQALSLFIFVTLIYNYCSCLNAQSINSSITDQPISPSVATFYVGPHQGPYGSGGGCGFGDADVTVPPYDGMTAAGNQNLYKSGAGCGNCYKVKCTEYPECSGFPVTVTITNECPGACNDQPIHFDMSVKAFRFLAKRGQADALQKRGIINIQYERVPCHYQSTPIEFRIGSGSKVPFYLAITPEYVNGDGDVGAIDLIVSRNQKVLPMKKSYGGTWDTGFVDPDTRIGPYSVRLTTIESRKSVLAVDVIPANFKQGALYKSSVNFSLK